MSYRTEREEAMDMLEAAIAANKAANNKFEPKLSFRQRCEILALYRKGCTREALAQLYGVDRRTITHIHNDKSPRYKNVREEELRLGRENFQTQYLIPEMMKKAAAFVLPVAEDKDENNRSANRKAGLHMAQNAMCDYVHRIIIQWVEKGTQEHILVSGWYYRDLDSEWPDQWSTPHGMPEATKTSNACYTAMLTDISDKL